MFILKYLDRRWVMVHGYVLIIIVATPYLPTLIRLASSQWPGGSIAFLVLGVEILIGTLLIVAAGGMFFYNRKKFIHFSIVIGGSIAAAYLFYLNSPNPYELTHLPQYALLSILVTLALQDTEEKKRKRVDQIMIRQYKELETTKKKITKGHIYLETALITCTIGLADEIYQGLLPTRFFNWYDILFNWLGALVGVTILWGMSRDGNS